MLEGRPSRRVCYPPTNNVETLQKYEKCHEALVHTNQQFGAEGLHAGEAGMMLILPHFVPEISRKELLIWLIFCSRYMTFLFY